MGYVIKTNYALRSNYGSYRDKSKIKYIVIHYTANDGDTDEANALFFKTKYRGASAHYFVDDDSITISVPDTYVAYSVGGNRYSNYKVTGGGSLYKIATNSNTLNIEMCDTIKNGKHDVSERTLENTIDLVRTLMKKYNIPITNVIRHFDVTGKSCPSYFVDIKEWNKFRNRISCVLTEKTNGYVYNGLDYSLVFNPTFYANKYADLKKAYGSNEKLLFNHFISNGMKEGRQAIATFNVNVYKNKYKDLRDCFGNDLVKYYQHYITNGYKEKRTTI